VAIIVCFSSLREMQFQVSRFNNSSSLSEGKFDLKNEEVFGEKIKRSVFRII
jgi:hypothetical protein